MQASIELREVVKRHGSTVAVAQLSFSVRRGEFFSILGPSGSGKTTTLRLIAGFEHPDQGDILIDGSEKGYLLQIFAHEMARQCKDQSAGPLFYEIIQRCGDEGFGGGNFRALFETIEIDQIAMKKVAGQLPLELL